MRVLLCTPVFEPAVDFGGPVGAVRGLGDGLLRRGHDIEVWCADYGPERTRVAHGQREVDGLTVRYFRRVGAYRWSPVVPQALAPGRDGFDVVHCFGYRDGLTFFAALGARWQRTPYVLEPLGMLSPGFRSTRLKRCFDATLGGHHVGGARAVIATSGREAAEIAARLPSARVVQRANPLPPGLANGPVPSSDLIRSVRANGELEAVWVGRISQTKGLDLLVEAVARVPGVKLTIAGPDDGDGARAVLDSAIARAGVADRVALAGPAWGDEKWSLLASSDVFVLPSRTESFGNAAAEAAASGLPVLLSDACGVTEVLAALDAAEIAPCTIDGFALALARLRDDRGRLAELARRAPAVRHALSIERIAAEQEAIYERVLG